MKGATAMTTKKQSKKTLTFVSKGQTGSTDDPDGLVADHGKIGNLNYKVYSRGVIHITDGKLTFKKDPDIFEEKLEEINFEDMSDGDEKIINGSGDNDNLVMALKEGELEISLRKKEFGIIRKLRGLIRNGKKNKSKQA
jgi:hypothetical protein